MDADSELTAGSHWHNDYAHAPVHGRLDSTSGGGCWAGGYDAEYNLTSGQFFNYF